MEILTDGVPAIFEVHDSHYQNTSVATTKPPLRNNAAKTTVGPQVR